MSNEPGKAVLTIFDTIIDNIKGSRPLKSDDTPLETYVYSQLVEGIMVDPDDFDDAWSPMGGIPMDEVVAEGQAALQQANAGDDPAAAFDQIMDQMSRAQKAFSAAFKTSMLVDQMIQVSSDEIYRAYPAGGRKVSTAYEGVIKGMQALAAPEPTPEVKARVEEARKVLYDLDDEGNILGKSRLHETYVNNAYRYADAKAEYAEAQQEHLMDPMRAAIWPVVSARYKREVEQAWDDLTTEGGDRIEQALDVIQSVGISIDDHMIAKAREVFDQWNVGLGGAVSATVPFSYVLPANWADPNARDIGWKKLKIKSSDYNRNSGKHSHFFGQGSSQSQSSQTSGGGGFSIFGFGVKGGGGKSSSSSSSQSSNNSSSGSFFKNDAKNLEIELEYGACTIVRPWLIGDLFHLRNWYLVNNQKHSISDGSLSEMQNDHLMPMIPEQFLCVRNIKIKSSEWGSDGQTLEQHFGRRQSSSSSSTSQGGGSAGFSFGPFSIGGGASHSKSNQNSQSSSSSGSSSSNRFSTTFDGRTLEIKGTQIVAWLSTVVPASAPLADPQVERRTA